MERHWVDVANVRASFLCCSSGAGSAWHDDSFQYVFYKSKEQDKAGVTYVEFHSLLRLLITILIMPLLNPLLVFSHSVFLTLSI